MEENTLHLSEWQKRRFRRYSTALTTTVLVSVKMLMLQPGLHMHHLNKPGHSACHSASSALLVGMLTHN